MDPLYQVAASAQRWVGPESPESNRIGAGNFPLNEKGSTSADLDVSALGRATSPLNKLNARTSSACRTHDVTTYPTALNGYFVTALKGQCPRGRLHPDLAVG